MPRLTCCAEWLNCRRVRLCTAVVVTRFPCSSSRVAMEAPVHPAAIATELSRLEQQVIR